MLSSDDSFAVLLDCNIVHTWCTETLLIHFQIHDEILQSFHMTSSSSITENENTA